MLQPPSTRVYDLIVIGSSAGGIEALSTLVASLPTNFAAPVVIAQHLDPDHLSHLGEILARHTTLTVRSVVDHEPLHAGVIYVVPADRDVEITDHSVQLRRATGKHPKPSVNRLLSSAARAHGERLIAVILTGTGSDGAEGARAVKAAGGMVMIENPATAAYASMPKSLAPSTVDLIADLPQIGPLLAELVAGVYLPAPDEADATLPQLLAQLREHSGLDFTTYKTPTILRRLQRRLVATGMATLTTYLHYLAGHPEEYQQLVASFLINVTQFFRDPDLFAALRTDVIPDLIAQARQLPGGQVRCWSAGCATGEEAYSLAMLFVAILGDQAEQFPVRIFATDIDAASLAFARRGVYPPNALARVPRDLVARCFTRRDGAYEVTPALRRMIIFGQHDLAQRPPFPNIDLVLCRNVLIYFTPDLQIRTLQLFAAALREGGYLALGKAETTEALAGAYTPVQPTLKLYRRHGERVQVPSSVLLKQAHLTLPYPIQSQQSQHLPMPSSAPPVVRRPPAVGERLGDMLLTLPLGVVVVDRHYDIQHINRAAQELFGIFRAALGEDLIHLITMVPTAPIRAVIDAALQHAAPPNEVIVTTHLGERRQLQVTAYAPAAGAATTPAEQVLLQIVDVTAQMQAHQADEAQRAQRQKAPAPSPHLSDAQHTWETERLHLHAELARQATQITELTTLNRTLAQANEEVTNANLALTTFNEKLLVHNEELQAAAEEIKTLNEELQAANEELETLNEEMEATVEELRATNDDLLVRTTEVQELATEREVQRQASEAKAAEREAILRSISDALLVLNAAGEVVLTNAAYEALFGHRYAMVAAEDETGQPLPPAALPHQRARREQSFRMTFTLPDATDGRRYLEAVGEAIFSEDVPQGAVITIRDITDRSLRRLQDEFLALASHELRSPLTPIQMSTQLLLRKLPQDDAVSRPLLETILRQAQRLQRLINDLTDVSRLQHNKLHLEHAPVDLHTVALAAQTSAMLTAPTLVIVVEAEEEVFIQGDGVRLEQILTNLLNNARKYAAESEQIVLRVRRVGDEVEVQVQDDGPGIPAAALPSLFQRFYQVAPEERASRLGLGLGLFIVHELVVAQGGTITVASVLGHGTTFTMRYPALAAIAEQHASAPTQHGQAASAE